MTKYNYRINPFGPVGVIVLFPFMVYYISNFIAISGVHLLLSYLVIAFIVAGAVRQIYLSSKAIIINEEFIEIQKRFVKNQFINFSTINKIEIDSTDTSKKRYISGVKVMGPEMMVKEFYIDLECLERKEDFVLELEKMIK